MSKQTLGEMGLRFIFIKIHFQNFQTLSDSPVSARGAPSFLCCEHPHSEFSFSVALKCFLLVSALNSTVLQKNFDKSCMNRFGKLVKLSVWAILLH
jgi:hypothetical protein